MTQQLTGRVRMYAHALTILSQRRGLCGRGVTLERGARYFSIGVRLRNELEIDKALGLAEPLALATNTQTVITKREGGLVCYQFQLAGAYWEKYTRADLTTSLGTVGVGLSDNRRQVDFRFDPPHSLVAGTTGSGKTETVKSILCGLFAVHSPQELNAIIVDPDKDHGDVFRNVAHLAGVPIASDPGDITRVLTYAHQAYLDRKRDNRRDAPPLVIVIDEAEDALADPRNLGLVAPIARHGRKYRCHLLLATQKPNESTLPSLLDKVNNRFIGLVQNAHLSAHLTGQAGLDCHKLTGEGDFMHVAGATQERLLVALATRQDFDHLPRGEMTPPDWDDVEPDLDDDEGVDSGPGRPISPVEAIKVAYYCVNGPGNVSQREARKTLDLGKDLHYRHRDFANELMVEIQRLLQVKGGNNGR